MGIDKLPDQALLFMDIKGYSQLKENKQENVRTFLDDYFKKLTEIGKSEDLVGMNPLIYFNTWGDAIVAIFSVVRYVMVGLDILNASFNTLKANLGETELRMRIVLHLGDVYRMTSGSFFGDSIITAARIEPLVSPDEIWVTDDFYSAMKKDEFLAEKVKNLSQAQSYLLPKEWGIKKIYKYDYKEKKEPQKPTNYLMIEIGWNNDGNTLEITPKEVCNFGKETLPQQERGDKLRQMESFLMNRDGKIQTFCAIGMQNFLELDGELCIGVRLKTAVNKEDRAYELIGKNCFNTGYKLIREKKEFPEDLHGIHNLFQLVKKLPGKRLSEAQLNELREKCIPIFDIRIGKETYPALIFVNYSRWCPRYEIGVCRVYEAKMAGKDKLLNFGADHYGKNEGTYWIWVRDGEIKAFSFFSIRDLDKKDVAVEENVLLRNTLSNVRYTPYISDEELDQGNILLHLFASPARSVLERF